MNYIWYTNKEDCDIGEIIFIFDPLFHGEVIEHQQETNVLRIATFHTFITINFI